MRVLVINPNSNQAVTDGMADALKPLEIDGGPEIQCVTLKDGPFGVETQADVESVTLPLKNLISKRDDADAYVIACLKWRLRLPPRPGVLSPSQVSRSPLPTRRSRVAYAAPCDRFRPVRASSSVRMLSP